MKTQIGLFGFGCVAQGFYEGLKRNSNLNAEIKTICVRDIAKIRPIADDIFTDDASDIFEDSSIDVIIELIDDAEAAFQILKEALESGRPVISANKKAIAEHLPELVSLQRKHHTTLLYEGAVGGAIPILNSIELFFQNQQILSLRGILNGTCNYILTQMNDTGISFDTALKEARDLGFAESDSYLDISGYDATFKAVILSYHAYGEWTHPDAVERTGIDVLPAKTILEGRKENQKLKLISSLKQSPNGVQISVRPHIINENDALYNVDHEKNAILIEGSFSGDHLFLGNGAGSFPTGSAVLNDLKLIMEGFKYAYASNQNLQSA